MPACVNRRRKLKRGFDLPFCPSPVTAVVDRVTKFENKMALRESVLSFPLRVKNVFIAAFYGRISCGLVTNETFEEANSFSVEHFEVVEFYVILINLLKSVANGPFPSSKFNFLGNNYWQVQSPAEMILKIKNGNEIIFSYEAFHDFLLCFAQLIFPSLGLRDYQKFMLESASNLSQTEVTQLNDFSFALKFINSFKDNFDVSTIDIYNNCILVSRFRDLILIYKKIMSIVPTQISDKNIEILLSAI